MSEDIMYHWDDGRQLFPDIDEAVDDWFAGFGYKIKKPTDFKISHYKKKRISIERMANNTLAELLHLLDDEYGHPEESADYETSESMVKASIEFVEKVVKEFRVERWEATGKTTTVTMHPYGNWEVKE